MGLNDEYSRDAYEVAHLDVDELLADEEVTYDDETWQDINSGELLEAWIPIREYAEENYLNLHRTFPEFVTFVMSNNDEVYTDEVCCHIENMWRRVCNQEVIRREGVTRSQFYEFFLV